MKWEPGQCHMSKSVRLSFCVSVLSHFSDSLATTTTTAPTDAKFSVKISVNKFSRRKEKKLLVTVITAIITVKPKTFPRYNT